MQEEELAFVKFHHGIETEQGVNLRDERGKNPLRRWGKPSNAPAGILFFNGPDLFLVLVNGRMRWLGRAIGRIV